MPREWADTHYDGNNYYNRLVFGHFIIDGVVVVIVAKRII